MSDDRSIILETLLLIRKGEDFSNRIIKDVLDKYSYLDRQHRSFIKRVCEGCVERKIELDYVIDSYSKTPTRKMKPVILCILEMSVYQLLYMDSVPDSAVCNEAVKLAEKKGFRNLKGFVNGILRNIARNDNPLKDLTLENGHSPEEILSVKYSMPMELIRHFMKNYPEQVEGILSAFMKEAPVTVRINESRCDDRMRALLEEEAQLRKLPEIEDLSGQCCGYSLSGYDRIENLRAYQQGAFQIQDHSAMQTVALAGIKKGDTVFDVCAAPGGKTIQAADELCKLDSANQGKVYSFDISPIKTDLIRENLSRAQFENVVVTEWDATLHNDDYVNQADVLIADLPCSGLGIIGRKADIKYHITKQGMEDLIQLQRKILSNVSDYVKAGGVLMYSTCTINPGENELQSQWIESHLPFKLILQKQIFPSVNHDGFYIAKFIKDEN